MSLNESIIADIQSIIKTARGKAVLVVDNEKGVNVLADW